MHTVLVRALFQTRILEESLINFSIPYRIIGNVRFYERQEIKDILAYVKLAMNQNDDLSFKRIINKPARGVGRVTILKIKDFANNQKISLFHTMEQIIHLNLFSGKIKLALEKFVNLINRWKKDFELIHHVEVVKKIIDESGYRAMLSKEGKLEAYQPYSCENSL